jgi:hypothetical protein
MAVKSGSSLDASEAASLIVQAMGDGDPPFDVKEPLCELVWELIMKTPPDEVGSLLASLGGSRMIDFLQASLDMAGPILGDFF